MKTCTKCNIEKPKTEFSKRPATKDGLQFRCKSCSSELHKVYRESNKERLSELNKAWRKANPDILERYRDENKEKKAKADKLRYKANIVRMAENNKAWREENQERCSANRQNRRSRIVNSDGSHTASDIKTIFASQRGLCASCKTKLFKSGKQKYHVDHIVALANGGSNDKYNLQCLCPFCNMSKGAKDQFHWAKENGKLL